MAAAVGGLTFGVAPGAKLHAVRILDCEGSGAGEREGAQHVRGNVLWQLEHATRHGIGRPGQGMQHWQGMAWHGMDVVCMSCHDASHAHTQPFS